MNPREAAARERLTEARDKYAAWLCERQTSPGFNQGKRNHERLSAYELAEKALELFAQHFPPPASEPAGERPTEPSCADQVEIENRVRDIAEPLSGAVISHHWLKPSFDEICRRARQHAETIWSLQQRLADAERRCGELEQQIASLFRALSETEARSGPLEGD